MKKTRFVANAALVAALYTALTLLSASLGLSGGAVQFRISEALCILPCFMPESIAGLALGCAVSNLLTGCAAADIIFGSLATLAAALFTYLLRKNRWLAALPPIVLNTAVVPALLCLVYKTGAAYPYLSLTVFIGEFVCCGILGELLYSALKKLKL